MTAPPGQHMWSVRGRRPDLAVETLPAEPSHLAREGSRCLVGVLRAEPRSAWGSPVGPGRGRARGHQGPSATPERTCF